MNHVLELRREGRTYQEIAEIAQLRDAVAAQKLLSKAIKKVLKETAEEVRSVELSRMDVLIKTIWNKALKGVNVPDGVEPDFRYFDRLKGLIEAKLRWCGAQPVEGNEDKSVTIVVQSFTKNVHTTPEAPTQIPHVLDVTSEINH